MNKLAVVTCAFLGLTGASAMAADMPVKAPPMAPPQWSWQGFYLGAFAGGMFGYDSTARNDTTQVVNTRTSGGTVGGLAGFNYQAGMVVLGLEGDLGWANANGSTNYISATSGAPEIETDHSSYSGHARARLGFAFGQYLPFIAGGAAFTNNQVTLQHLAPLRPAQSITDNLVGGSIGAGLDAMFTQNWVGRVEYIFDFYGQQTFGFNAATAGEFSDRLVTTQQQTVRAALIYKF